MLTYATGVDPEIFLDGGGGGGLSYGAMKQYFQ